MATKGGWIKLWKDMLNDPRVVSAASELAKHYEVTRRSSKGPEELSENDLSGFLCNAVTGALVTLWWYADEHIGNDDLLGVSPNSVDAIVRLQGIYAALPREWIDKFDATHVVLPDYCKKNSLITRRKRAAKSNTRVAEWRAARKNIGNCVTSGVTTIPVTRVTTALHGGEDIDIDSPEWETRKACVTALPTALQEVKRKTRKPHARQQLPADFALTEAMREQAKARAPGCDVETWFQDFTAHHQAHGKAMLDWSAAWRTWISNGLKFGYPRQQEPASASHALPLFKG